MVSDYDYNFPIKSLVHINKLIKRRIPRIPGPDIKSRLVEFYEFLKCHRHDMPNSVFSDKYKHYLFAFTNRTYDGIQNWRWRD